jgi:putative transcription factor
MEQKFQDWNEIKWDKRGERKKGETNSEYMNNQLRKNNVVSKVKPRTLNQNKINVVTNAHKIDKEEETFIHKKVSLTMSKKIAQARMEKKLSQKELAFKLSLPFKIIQDYESGKAIPNAMILNKIEKILEKRVRD